MNKKGSIMK